MRVTCETYIGAVTVCAILFFLSGLLHFNQTPHDEHAVVFANFTILKPKPNAGIKCIRTKTTPPFSLCPVPSGHSHVSHLYRKNLLWSSQVTRSMEKALENYPNATFIDVGVLEGYHSMMAATRGNQVLAVESNKHIASYLRKSLHVDKPQGPVRLFYHSLADHGLVSLSPSARMHSHFTKVRKTDVKTIYLNELVPYIRSNIVIMKLDVDGRECKAWLKSHIFFATKSVPYIFMAWHKMVVNSKKQTSPCNAQAVNKMINNLQSRGYRIHNLNRLNDRFKTTNPVPYVLFKHKTAKRLSLS